MYIIRRKSIVVEEASISIKVCWPWHYTICSLEYSKSDPEVTVLFSLYGINTHKIKAGKEDAVKLLRMLIEKKTGNISGVLKKFLPENKEIDIMPLYGEITMGISSKHVVKIFCRGNGHFLFVSTRSSQNSCEPLIRAYYNTNNDKIAVKIIEIMEHLLDSQEEKVPSIIEELLHIFIESMHKKQEFLEINLSFVPELISNMKRFATDDIVHKDTKTESIFASTVDSLLRKGIPIIVRNSPIIYADPSILTFLLMRLASHEDVQMSL